jgi:ligand-binding sensor domain-containing protein
LSDERVRSLYKDRDGNVWIGTWDGGVCKLAGEMMVSFGKREGLAGDVHMIIEGHDGVHNRQSISGRAGAIRGRDDGANSQVPKAAV